MMDDLIVVILTLLIAVIGAASHIKKRKQVQPENMVQPENNDNDQSQPNDFWDVLEEFGVQPKQPKLNEPEQKIEAAAEQLVEQKKYDFRPEYEGKDSIFKENSIKDQIKENIEKEEKEKISDTFSLRKAVIYSEILNRKYT